MSSCGEVSTLFSIVVPVYKNEDNILPTVEFMVKHLDLFTGYRTEIIMVCDGSPDNSWERMVDAWRRYPEKLKLVRLSRNFGQGAAIHCGMEVASGDVVGVISADLQDPFELFVDMLEKWRQGARLVIASRSDREEHGFLAACSKLMHSLVRRYINPRYPRGGFDFFLLDRVLVEEFLVHDQISGGMQLLLLWFGYDYVEIPYSRRKRAVGKSSWSISKKLNAALRWITLFSPVLLRMILIAGLGISLLGLLVVFVSVAAGNYGLLLGFLIVFCTGLCLSSIGILGEYLMRVLDYVKGMPRYIVSETVGIQKKGVFHA